MFYLPSPHISLAFFQVVLVSNNFLPPFYTSRNSKCHSAMDIIYLDCKAFDSVPHEQLLIKLWNRGITGFLWLLLKDYLTIKWQLTWNFKWWCIFVFPAGYIWVPQGSSLGPLLFIIYINDLSLFISKSFSLLYADDCKCLHSISSPSDCFLL